MAEELNSSADKKKKIKMPKIKNIIIFVAIAAIFALIYVYFIKPDPADTAVLVSSSESAVAPSAGALTTEENSAIAKEFLALLLSVKSIKLDDAIFSDDAFISLHDSSIILVPDGNEGRPNPFAPIGSDTATVTLPPICALPKVLSVSTNTCVNPPPICTLPKVLNTATNTCVNPPAN